MQASDRELAGTKRAYRFAFAMLIVAFSFPIGLMIFNPTLMFQRGWEQYVGTGIYFCAVIMLANELRRLWANEKAFDDASDFLGHLTRADRRAKLSDSIGPDEHRVLPRRIRQLSHYVEESRTPSVGQLMEINREGSGLDQETASGRFTIIRYILYLLPVIGFIGTVEGISKALKAISEVLPMVKELDGFMSNLTRVTDELQIAFDSTLLALFLSAALMLVLTLVYRRAEDMLARVDRWVVENVLPHVGSDEGSANSPAQGDVERVRRELALVLEKFAQTVDRLPTSLAGFQRGADAIGKIGHDLEAVGTASDSIRKGVASLARIETTLASQNPDTEQLIEIRRGIDRTCHAVESLSNSMAHAFERSNRASQEQLARTLNSLKDALDMLNVSMEQGNSLYRNIVKKMFQSDSDRNRDDSIRVA